MASHVQRGDLDRTVPRSVSVTTMASVCHPLESVSAALDTQENGASTSVQLVLMVMAVQRRVSVRTTVNATTPMECVCVSQDSQERHVSSDFVLKDTTASGVMGNVCALLRKRTAATQCQGSVHVSLVGQASTAMRHVPQDFMASPASSCASARMVQTATV